jgi:two-component system, NarL family, sensor histidine kinase UhpB
MIFRPQIGSSRRPRLSILGRALLSSTALLALIFVLLLVSPVTVSAPVRGSELVVLAVAFAVMLLLNAERVRRALAPLQSFADQMQQVDLRHPERARVGGSSQSAELLAFTEAFNAMLDRLTDERRAGARAALLAQERERLRIARALHDEAGQTLTAVALEIERMAEQGPENERERMHMLVGQLHTTLEDIRRIARELRPEALDDLGLINALIALSSRAARQGGLQIERRLSENLPSLPKELELVIYRVAQEALTNVLRHAEATRCVIELRSENEEIELRISDDGRGISAQAERETIGIEGMRERALLVGGSLRIDSQSGEGTTVRLSVPIGADA